MDVSLGVGIGRPIQKDDSIARLASLTVEPLASAPGPVDDLDSARCKRPHAHMIAKRRADCHRCLSMSVHMDTVPSLNEQEGGKQEMLTRRRGVWPSKIEFLQLVDCTINY